MRILFTIVFGLLFSFSGFSQTPSTKQNENVCKVGESPAVQNLRLGMTLKSVIKKASFKLTKAQGFLQENGSVTYQITNPRLNVENVTLDFYKDKLHAITVRYGDKIVWKDTIEFKDYTAKALNLPSNWNDVSTNYPNLRLTCSGFQISAFYFLSAYQLEIFNPKVSDELKLDERKTKEQMEAKERKQKESFKP